MADYFTQFSFVVPVTPEQGQWLAQVHALAAELIGYAEDGEAWEHIEGPQDVVSAALEVAERRDASPGIEVTHDENNGTVWLRSDESGDAEYTVDLVRAFLKQFELDLVLSFEWANTCSKPQLDGFGGGAVVISRRNAIWFTTATFVAKAFDAETRRLKLKPDEDLESVALDDAVHDTAAALAADATHGGMACQHVFLLEHGWNPPEELLRVPSTASGT